MIGIGVNIRPFLNKVARAAADYYNRITADGGVSESPDCVNSGMSDLDRQNLLNSSSLLIIPSGYKGGKLYAEIPTNGNGDLTWTRGGDAFRTNASGVLQRVPWNLVQYSEDFTNAIWSKEQITVTANSTSAPNGTTTADTLVENTASAVHRASYYPANTISGNSYTMSLYLKNNGRRYLYINCRNAFNAGSTFDLQNGTVSTVGIGTASIENIGNGWYRCSVTGTCTTTGAYSMYYQLNNSGVATDTTYTGDGTSGVFIWGAQLVEGTTVQTYLPTTDRLNFPRLSYMYGSCPSALLEPQRTNLILQSQDFDNAWWSKLNATITANSTTAPDGTTTADTLDDGTSSSTFHRVLGTSLTITAGSTYSYSIYVKKNTMRYVRIVLNEVSDTFKWFAAQFDLDNATATTGVGSTAGSTVVSSSITSVGNGWYRCTLVGSMTITTSAFPIIYASDGTAIASGDSRGSVSYTGTNKQLYLWGAQLELGAYPTTYIPTTSATATRVADSFSRSNIYTNGLISASGGTWFVELRGNVALLADTTDGLWLGTSSNVPLSNGTIFFRQGGGSQRVGIWKYIGGASSAIYSTTTETVKLAIKWNGTTADIFENGTKVISATSFAHTDMEFLYSRSGRPTFIQQMALFPTPLSDTDCELLTGTAYSSYESMATALGYYVI